MIPRPSLSLTFAAYAVWGLYAPSVSAAQPFAERYALATDRAAILKELVPGTNDYFFYSALYHQTQGDPQKAAALLREWEEASSGPNGRRDILKNRAALLAYDKDPAGTLAWLREKLSLEFNHQRETEEARAELPSVLDPALISFAAFEQKAIGGTESLENVTDAGLYRLTQPVEKWKLTEIRALLSRLQRPDFPKLVDIIDRELKEKDAAFGKFPIHTLLTSDQLAELQKRRPQLLNNQTFTAAVMTRLRPLEFEDPDRDSAVRGAWLERLWAYAATLNPNAHALKANLLYHLLAHDERQGKLDPQRLIAYLKLPRPVRYISAQYRKDNPDLWKHPAALDFDPSAFTGTAPVGDDEALIRRLLIRYLTTEKEDAITPLISAGFLNELLAEAKLTTGAPDSQRWLSMLSPESITSLRDRTDIEFDPASRPVWNPEDVVTLDVWLKNTPSLLVRVYEINTANVHRTGEEVNTGLDLDGLTANLEQKREFKDAPILRSKQTFSFPELNGKRGVWIIEFIGNGKASRALIRKGGLRTIVRQTSAGTAVTVLDEKLKPVPKAFAMIGPKQITGDDKGLILLPLSTQPGPQKIVIDDGTGFTALETIALQGEAYTLHAGFHVPRESLLPGHKATLLIRPRLQSNGRPVLLESLEKAKVTIASETLDGTPASVVIPLEKLAEDNETTVEFAVPDRLKSLAFSLSGEVKSTLTGTPVQLSASDSLEVNTVTTAGQVSDLHLSQNAGQWVLQCLGLNGEARPSREVNVTFQRGEFGESIEVEMKTDATGSIALGALNGIESISASTEDADRDFPLPKPAHLLPEVIHLKAGQPLMVPWSSPALPTAGEVSLIELAPSGSPSAPGGRTAFHQPARRDAAAETRVATQPPGRPMLPAARFGGKRFDFDEEKIAFGAKSSGFGVQNSGHGAKNYDIGVLNSVGGDKNPATGVLTSVTGEKSSTAGVLISATGENSPAAGVLTSGDGEKSFATGVLSFATGEKGFAAGVSQSSPILKCATPRPDGHSGGGMIIKRLVPLPAGVTGGFLIWKDLPAGTYRLTIHGAETLVRIAPGDAIEGHAVAPTATVQLTANRPLTVTGMADGEIKPPAADAKAVPALIFHIGNVSPETRVHLLTSRFLPEFEAMDSLGAFSLAAPSVEGVSWQPSRYLSSRNIGDEYRYVLERRAAARFAGNMLAKPGLLINPWEIAVTNTEKEKLEELQKAQDDALLPDPSNIGAAMDSAVALEAKPGAPGAPPPAEAAPAPGRPDLSFLATPAPALLNLRPDKAGNVVIPRAALGDRQYLRVLAIDRESSAVRDFSLPSAALPPRDLRLARQLNPAQHFSRQNRVTVLEADAAFRFDDALAAQFQAIGHLGAVQQLFFNLTQNPLLNEFSWLLEWKTFDDAKKRSLYSQYACHELNFFLQRKDRAFFDAVVQPYLASKRERTFMDDYLLGSDLTRYLAPWPYGRLNALERILLAERMKEDQPTARRMAEDWINMQPVNRGRDAFLFETALRGRALVVNQAGAEGRFVMWDTPKTNSHEDVWYGNNRADVNGPADWYSDTHGTAEGGQLLEKLNGKGFFLTTRSNSPETTLYGTQSIVSAEIIKRQQRVRESLGTEQEADRAFAKQDYAGAIERYQYALNVSPNGTSNKADRARIVAKFSQAAIIHARELGHRGEFAKAKSLLGGVLGDDFDPGNKDAQNLLQQIDDPDRFHQAVTPKLLAQTEEVTQLFTKGLGYYELGQFNEAQTEFNRILAIDPYNTAARRQLERTEREITNYLKSARDHTRLKMLGDVDDLWVTAVPGSAEDFIVKEGKEVFERQFLGGAQNLLGFRYRAGTKAVSNAGESDPTATGDFDAGVTMEVEADADEDGYTVDLNLANAEGEMLAKFKARGTDGTVRLFRQQDPTKVWAEQQYYRLTLEAQTADLVPMNRFWRDYALWDGKGGFLSTNVADAAGSFSQMVLALAVLDLPFPGEFKAGKVETKDNVLTLTPASRLLLFHQDILPAEADAAGAKLLVSQNFYREGDRYIEQAGEKTDKFVTAEFLTGAVYGCQVVVTNPSSSPQRVDVLFQIPAGALPVKSTRRVQSLPVTIEPYRTQTLDFHFYFPDAGKFAHFPVHISRNDKTAASAAAFTFNVVARPTINDPASWDYVSQHGTDNEVLSFLAQHNLYFLDMEKVLWRLQNSDFFKRVIAHLKERHHFDEGVWSYAALHNVQPYLQEYLQQSPLSSQCGPVFDAPVLTVNPVEKQMYQHLEYSPLINARAHRLGSAHRILNVKFGVQWESLMRVLAFRPQLSAEDWLAVASYLATQDRIEEALAAFAKVNRAAVAEKLQYEYLRAWLAMCQEDTATARRIAGALSTAEAGLPPHWKRPFAQLMAQLDELEGKPTAGDPDDSREAMQNAAADREPVLQLSVANRAVTVQFRHLDEVTVRYYPIDLEFLFSSSPFLNQSGERTAVIRPARSEKVMLPAGGDRHILALPAAFQNANVLVEVSGGGVTKATAVYAHSLDVTITESFGQLTVQHEGKALPRAYVKVYAQVEGEAAPRFYKDGYTDLRGKFDYASLSTDDLNRVTRFAILVMSEDAGSLVREVKPPAR